MQSQSEKRRNGKRNVREELKQAKMAVKRTREHLSVHAGKVAVLQGRLKIEQEHVASLEDLLAQEEGGS
jgi:hypothetical protein